MLPSDIFRTALAALATIPAVSSADSVIGDFENESLDGWVVTEGATSEFGATGATLGGSALKVSDADGAWTTVLQYFPLDKPDVMKYLTIPGAWISFDCTGIGEENPGGWLQMWMVVNSAGGGYQQFGGVGVPVNGTDTVIIELPPEVQTALADSVGQWGRIEIIMNAAGGTPNAWHVDNIRVAATLSEEDTDNDGLFDAWEDLHFGNADGIADAAELALQDGTGDGYPVPDGDGLNNAGEHEHKTDPGKPDSDGDGFNDGAEVAGTDNSGISHGYGPTNPASADTDSDGLSDNVELSGEANQANSLEPTDPTKEDTDDDGMDDHYEIICKENGGLDPNTDDADGNLDNDPGLDGENDMLTNLDEYFGDSLGVQTRADFLDTDDDGYPDHVEDNLGGWFGELATGTDPTNPDTDGDGFTDGMENPDIPAHNPPTQYQTDPNAADSDFDDWSDREEVDAGTDPADDASFPIPMVAILDALINGDFESTDVPAGENDNVTGWGIGGSNDRTKTVDTDDGADGIDNGSWNNTPGAASQVVSVAVNPASDTSWLWQDLIGTSSLNGESHLLTGRELVGQTFTFSARIGIQSFSEWPTAHSIVEIGIQNKGSWEWQTSARIYTGTQDEADDLDIEADFYLDLDDTDPNGDSVVWTEDLLVEGGLPNSSNTTTFSINVYRSQTDDQARVTLDDLSIRVPGSGSGDLKITRTSFNNSGDLEITFSPGGTGFILTSSDDLATAFAEEMNATFNGTDTFTIPADQLSSTPKTTSGWKSSRDPTGPVISKVRILPDHTYSAFG